MTNKQRPLAAAADFDEFEIEDSRPTGSRKHKNRRQESKVVCLFVTLLSTLCIFVVGVLVYTNSSGNSRDASNSAPTGPTTKDFDPQQNWGAYSPYFTSGVSFAGISEKALHDEFTLPDTCSYKQVHMLHRHGDRFPAPGTTELMQQVAAKLESMTAPPADAGLKWLEKWNYTLGQDILVGKGVANMFDSGSRFWGTHGRLLYNASWSPFWNDDFNVFENGTARPKPVLRATTQYRIEDSARAWAAGFFGTYGHPSTGVDPREHYDLVLQPEQEGSNNSLAPSYGCPNTEQDGAERGKELKKEWYKIYLADATTRLQAALPGYEDMKPKDVLGLQDICIFETAAYGHSAFCHLFTVKEWRGFEYHMDLKFYGDVGFGSGLNIGVACGVPYLTELQARLKNEYITTTDKGVNLTLDSNPETFPLHQPFYLDITHDTTIYSVLSALRFDWLKEDLPTDKIKAPRQNIISRLTPFGARLYIEILDCDGDELIRMKLNDRVLPLQDLKYCPENKMGFCPKKNFLQHLDWALKKIDFVDVCYGNHNFTAIEES